MASHVTFYKNMGKYKKNCREMGEIREIWPMTTYMNTSATGAFLTNHSSYEEAVAA